MNTRDYGSVFAYRQVATINPSVTTRHKLIIVDSSFGVRQSMVGIKRLTEEILVFFHEADSRGRLNVTVAALYKAFEKKASYDVVQRAISFLVERDLIAPLSYSLTAKGRREHSLKRKG
ncbi:MAG: hypothetical protein ABSA92_02400 [Candidatus Bathyarchaeia archaeon]